jgi:hypothetical protein
MGNHAKYKNDSKELGACIHFLLQDDRSYY